MEEEYCVVCDEYGEGSFEVDMGVEVVCKLFMNFDFIKFLEDFWVEMVEIKSKQKCKDLINCLKIVELICDSDNRLEWMVLDVIFVILFDLCFFVFFDLGNFVMSDLNDLYW